MRHFFALFATLLLATFWGSSRIVHAQQTDVMIWADASRAAKDAGCGYTLGRGETLVSCIELTPAARDALGAGGDRLQGRLLVEVDGETDSINAPKIIRSGAERLTVDGLLESSGDLFQLSIAGTAASGFFRRGGTLYEVKPIGSGLNAIVAVDESERTQDVDDFIHIEESTLPWRSDEMSKSGSSTITMLLLWDDNLLAEHGQSGLDAMEDSYMAYLNQAILDGGTSDVTFTVAQSSVISYDETQFADMADDLAALQDTSDSVLDYIHDDRLTARADLVHLFLPSYKQSTCGIAYSGVVGAAYGFGVTGISGCGADTFAHEVGHNLGMNHDPYVTSSPNFLWGHGYVDLSNGFRTIMSYQNECADNGVACPRVRLFSDPGATYGGVPVGTADNPPSASSFNVRTLRANAPSRANYSDVLSACKPNVYGGTTGPATARIGEEISFDVPMQDSGTPDSCDPVGSYGLYLHGGSGSTYLISRQSVALPSSITNITFAGTPSGPEPPTGTYDVRLYLEATGSYYSSIASIEILPAAVNQAPTAAFTSSSTTGVAPHAITFDASSSSDPDGDALTYSWSFGDGASDTGASVSHTFAAAGTYAVTLTVSDGSLTDATTETITITAANQAPTAAFTASSTTGVAPHSISFDASSSSDPDGDALTYEWSFGDGASDTGASVSHTFASAGTYAVTLTVSDGSLTDAATETITITAANQAPTAAFTSSSTTGVAPHAISFDASSSSDPDGDALTYSWSFGDGAIDTGASVSHTFASAGTYAVTLTVSDGSLTDAATETITITAANQAPTAAFTSSSTTGVAPHAVTFDASSSSDPDGDALTYEWSFGDGASDTGASVSHTFAAAGTYTVTLLVSDGLLTDSQTVSVLIASGVGTEDDALPQVFALLPAYPNPFNPSTRLAYTLPATGSVSIWVTDLSGRVVRRLIQGRVVSAGRHDVLFDAAGLPSGRYVIAIQWGTDVRTQIVSLLK